MKPIIINVRDIIKQSNVTMTVRLRGVNQLRVRMWISLRLIRLGMWLIHGHVEFEGGELPEIKLEAGESPHPMLCVQHGGSPRCEKENQANGMNCPECENTLEKPIDGRQH